MSLFIDVIDNLSSRIKKDLLEILGRERKSQERSVRKICEVCSKYLDYGELRYDRMEDGIARLKEKGRQGNALYDLLMAVLHESLDEDQVALEHFIEFTASAYAASFHSELQDFITLGKFATLKDFTMLEKAGTIMVERYTGGDDITDTLSNLYLKVESEEFVPVFQRLADRARELYPANLSLEGFRGFINMKGKDYGKALDSFLIIKDGLEQDKDDLYYNDQLAAAWDNIAGCYLKLEDAAKTIESCDTAIAFDCEAQALKLGYSPLYKKAEALLMAGEKEQVLALVEAILKERPDDEKALEIKGRIYGE